MEVAEAVDFRDVKGCTQGLQIGGEVGIAFMTRHMHGQGIGLCKRLKLLEQGHGVVSSNDVFIIVCNLEEKRKGAERRRGV
jgi:hypothetical protein